MKAIILGLIIIAAALVAVLPAGLGWWEQVLDFLRGALPVAALVIGAAALVLGIADLRERFAKK